MAIARNGFTPLRTPDSRYVRRVPVGGNGLPVMVGDAVCQIAGICFAATAATNPTTGGFGVVLAVYTTAGRPLTHQNSKCIVSGGVGLADVCWDENMTYSVQCVTSIGTSNIGTNVMIDASATNNFLRTGRSTMSVDLPASVSSNELFKIVGISPYEPNLLTGTTGQTIQGGGANNGVEVAWNRHITRGPTAVTQ